MSQLKGGVQQNNPDQSAGKKRTVKDPKKLQEDVEFAKQLHTPPAAGYKVKQKACHVDHSLVDGLRTEATAAHLKACYKARGTLEYALLTEEGKMRVGRDKKNAIIPLSDEKT